MRGVSVLMIFAMAAPFEMVVSVAGAQEGAKPAASQEASKPAFSQGELEQVVAPIALYPDSLLVQVLMASTYPLEVVQADRWAKKNKDLKGDALAKELEKQTWDPSVKSLVQFPQVLDMMNQKLEWTQKLGDAFLAQQKDVMDAVQKLRKKAEAEGNLKTTKEQKVIVEKETQTIVIEPANPQVVYVPTYNPTVVYGAWPYPSYPPYAYYPPGYVPGAALFSFGVGMAIGAAWGYAWGGANWGGGDVNINTNRNTNINNKIDRGKYAQQRGQGQGGKGNWQHNPQHRQGVSYRDKGTAQKFNRGSSNQAVQSRENFRGRTESGRQDMSRGGGDQSRGGQGAGQRGGPQASTREAGGGGRGDAFSGMDRGGSSARDASSRGSSSRSGSSFSGGGSRGGSRSSGGGGGGSRGGGGGSRGGGGGGGRR